MWGIIQVRSSQKIDSVPHAWTVTHTRHLLATNPILPTSQETLALENLHNLLTKRRNENCPFFNPKNGSIAEQFNTVPIASIIFQLIMTKRYWATFADTVKKVMSQMKVHFFDPSDPNSIIGILATFELCACLRATLTASMRDRQCRYSRSLLGTLSLQR